MATLDRPGATVRRVVLIDFDWKDADLLPELLRLGGTAVGLVTGADAGDAGVRVAALCGLPSSIELADLARELFDVALVGERSPRREQLHRLLHALGTPVESPAEFLGGTGSGAPDAPHAVERTGPHAEPDARHAGERAAPHTQAPDARHAGERAAAHRQHAVDPDAPHAAAPADALAPPPRAEPLPPAGPEAIPQPAHPGLPGPDDGPGLEQSLAQWCAETSASAASLHLLMDDTLDRRSRVGPDDPLLDSLVQLAFRLDSPHVMLRDDGPQRGRVWAAWPLRANRQRGVLGVAAADATRAHEVWEAAVEALSRAWSAPEHAAGDPPMPIAPLDTEAFSLRLQMAVERHRAEGFRFALHRLSFEGPEAALTELLRVLPQRLRGTDCLCRPAPAELLLLCAGSSRALAHVLRRVEALWRDAWASQGDSAPAPAVADERIELYDAGNPDELIGATQDPITGP